jgi:hypothetical protein
MADELGVVRSLTAILIGVLMCLLVATAPALVLWWLLIGVWPWQ